MSSDVFQGTVSALFFVGFGGSFFGFFVWGSWEWGFFFSCFLGFGFLVVGVSLVCFFFLFCFFGLFCGDFFVGFFVCVLVGLFGFFSGFFFVWALQ